MNRLLPFILSVLLVGCHKHEVKHTTAIPFCRDLEDIRAEGKLVALTDLSSSSYFVYRGVPMGFEYEVLKAFAEHIGVRLEMKIVDDMDRVIYRLQDGQGDIIAANYTITGDRLRLVSFSDPVLETHQVLIQRASDSVVTEPSQLRGKTIHVRVESSFHNRLRNLMNEIGGIIDIRAAGQRSTEDLIRDVSEGRIDFTVADHNVALLNQTYYPNIDINTSLSLKQEIGWAMRQTSTELLDSLNAWFEGFKKTPRFAMIHLKYFKARSRLRERVTSEYSSVGGKRISPYDEAIKKESERLGWDWRLLAAMIHRESNFNAEAESWMGAVGLMQLIPETAEHYGVDSLSHPQQNIHAGVSYLVKLQDYWMRQGLSSTQLYCFTLASYNVGLGHILDACRLAEKHQRSRKDWSQVSTFLRLKSEREFYTDPVVKHGYCRGSEPVAYVDNIMTTWNHYQNANL